MVKIMIWKIVNISLNSIYHIKGISYNGNTATLHVVYLGSNPNISKAREAQWLSGMLKTFRL